MNLKQGEIKDFNVKAFLDVANELVRADEVERALLVLDNLPAFYRDHPLREVLELKNEILSRVATPAVYMENPSDIHIDFEDRNGTSKSLRAQLLQIEIAWLNEQNLTPHLIDYGPGEYWLPILLKNKGFKFTYFPIHLSDKAFLAGLPYFKDRYLKVPEKNQPVIFIAGEIIEHLSNESDIKTEMLRSFGLADVVHVSTPRYTNNFLCTDWRKDKGELGHLRAYTPNEFVISVVKMFPEYHWKLFNSFILHMRLINKNSKHEIINQMALEKFDSVTVSEGVPLTNA